MCACPLSLEMFSDWGNVIAMPGIGLSLCGPVCSSMRAFKLAEVGVKPLKTELKSSSEIALDQILEILK